VPEAAAGDLQQAGFCAVTPALAAALLLAAAPEPSPPTVAVPRVPDAAVTIDGVLDEPVWREAAVLRDFSQYLPLDNRPADDSTTVLVWYSATAIHFGIRAWQDSAGVRATLADRDRIDGDDYVRVVLDTFNDRRQAYLFAVNPLGVQADGTLQDAARKTVTMMSAAPTGAYAIDLSQDFVFESRGRITASGYDVEIRIPFKTLRYRAADPQDWGINVIRRVQASGHEHTWTRVLQTGASFLGQSGILTGLTDLRRGLVLDLTPEATSAVTGGPDTAGWAYAGGSPALGMTARWGITPNLTLNGTVNPDYSQIEADVAQLQFDPREALYYPEKRPFFLDGLDMFRSPTQLIYTRRLVDPVGAAKATGKVAGTNVAFLSGADTRDVSVTGDDTPFYNLLRVRRDIGDQHTLGLVYTDRVEGGAFNRVAAADGRFVLGEAYALTAQGGGSVTGAAGESVFGPFWNVGLNRAGRSFGLTVATRGFSDDFRAASGFISRGGIVYAGLTPSYTVQGRPGATVESWTGSLLLDGRWDYDRFFDGRSPNDPRLHFNTGVTLRGGWQIGTSLLVESFAYPAELYTDYFIERTTDAGVDTIPYTGTDRLSNLDVVVNVSTPRFQTFSLDLFFVGGRDENFFEWAPAWIAIGTLDVTWRPSEQLRVNALYNHQQYLRPSDGSTVGMRRVPRLKIEYQLTRAIFLRFVGQYDAEVRDSLRDDSRTGDPILLWDPVSGTFTRTSRIGRNDLRFDWLFSYRPTPGTVVFLGYGGSLTDASAFSFRDVERRSDGFFVKLSYLWRVQ
jgi:hypothetical protein